MREQMDTRFALKRFSLSVGEYDSAKKRLPGLSLPHARCFALSNRSDIIADRFASGIAHCANLALTFRGEARAI